MKKLIFLISILLLSSCHMEYFEFDTVEHYKIAEQFSDPSFDQELPSLVFDDTLPSLDENFEKNIHPYYLFKSRLDSLNTEKIREIYRSKIISRTSAMESRQIYKDILVFKKGNNITGVSKICLGCKGEINYDQFGMVKHIDMDDYNKLEKILK